MFKEVDNLCNTCNGACCRKMCLPKVSSDDFRKLTPDGTLVEEIGSPDEFFKLFAHMGLYAQGIHYLLDPNNTYTVFIVSPCPNLQPDNKCGIYEQRPVNCREFPQGGQECKAFRRRESNVFTNLNKTWTRLHHVFAH